MKTIKLRIRRILSLRKRMQDHRSWTRSEANAFSRGRIAVEHVTCPIQQKRRKMEWRWWKRGWESSGGNQENNRTKDWTMIREEGILRLNRNVEIKLNVLVNVKPSKDVILLLCIRLGEERLARWKEEVMTDLPKKQNTMKIQEAESRRILYLNLIMRLRRHNGTMNRIQCI